MPHDNSTPIDDMSSDVRAQPDDDPARIGWSARDLASSDDDILARAAGGGDRAAFNELVRRTTPMLLRYARRMIPDRHEAEDITQETLIAAWRGLDTFSFSSSFRTWLFAIAHRKVIDLRRRRGMVVAEVNVLVEVPDSHAGPGDSTMVSSLQQALEVELSALAPVPRAVWWLREMEGLGHQEIARILNISPTSVRGHLQRSRSRLAQQLRAWRPDAADTGVASKSAAAKKEQR